ncbi:MerR family transcriptional regulator [Treponema primitia]|uniref:MerR family transcriptional regulator n=1 Tax=Treponema primitia TaxID=88058 RepID=UPI00025554FB|nr:MerR family transcriptional regulator [Treponema primitia]
MAAYGIGDLEKLLGVKAHVIRYWEKEVPLIQSRKDLAGRRVYAKRDLLIFFRLKYLLYDRRFTIEGAREQLFREFTGGGIENQNLKAYIEALRSDLVDLYFLVHQPDGPTQPPANDQGPV